VITHPRVLLPDSHESVHLPSGGEVDVPKTRPAFKLWTDEFTGDTYGNIEILFDYMPSHPSFDEIPKRLELLNRLNEIQGVAVPADGIIRRPTIPLRVLQDDAALGLFLVTLGWVVEEIRRS
jgi:hypothetical protein